MPGEEEMSNFGWIFLSGVSAGISICALLISILSLLW